MLKAKSQAVQKQEKMSAKILAHFSTKNFSTKKNKSENITRNYNQYFTSGVYKQRYPRINSCTAKFIYSYADTIKSGHVLDYGCGSGRYLINLLQRYPRYHFTAYDISAAPLKLLNENLQAIKATERVKIIPHFDSLFHKLTRNKTGKEIDIALLLFGVLSHIASPIQRQDVLSFIRRNMSANGRLIISVPNKNRRFLSLQKQQGSHEITYQRKIDEQTVQFYYHLYSVDSIINEVNMAGLKPLSIKAESLLPESWVTNHPWLGWIDRQLCRWAPASWGYGILISCEAHHH